MGKGNCQDSGEGRRRVSALISFYLLASWEHKSGDDEKSEVKRAGHRCSL